MNEHGGLVVVCSSSEEEEGRKAAAGPRSTRHSLLLLLPFVVTSSCCSRCCFVIGLRHGHEEEDQPAAGGPQPRRGDHQHRTLSCLWGVGDLFLLLLVHVEAGCEPHDEALKGRRARGIGRLLTGPNWLAGWLVFSSSTRF